jgi:hypothetical protein
MKTLILTMCLMLGYMAFAQDLAIPLPVAAPVVSVPSEPPAWIGTALAIISSLPVVGPYVAIAAQWLGVVASVMTLLVTALVGILKALSLVLKAAKMADLAVKISALLDHPVMYWLKYFSMYNAKKKDSAKPS